MKRTEKELDRIMDRTIADIRNQTVEGVEAEKAAERVWKKLTSGGTSAQASATPVDQIRGCADFQALIPAYLEGSLSSARVLLLEDHTHECIPCRKAMKSAKQGDQFALDEFATAPKISASAAPPTWKWAMAAGVILALGAMTFIWYNRLASSLQVFHAVVYAMDGPAYTLGDNGSTPLKVGDSIKAGQTIRAGRDADTMVQLPDGSIVEMKGRSEISVTDASEGMTIHLDRGDIIVQAAKQHSRHLYVATDDCRVSVVGTVFSVNSGTKGSRVAVAQGEVNVDSRGEKHVLHPGDEVATSASIEPAPVKNEFAWSKNSAHYLELLADVASLQNEIKAKVSSPQLRYSSTILDTMPANTVFYVALPNMTGALAESSKIIDQRIDQNPALKQWWESNHGSGGHAQFDDVVKQMAGFGQYLGDEIVASAQLSDKGEPDNLLVTASVLDPAGFRSYLTQQLQSAGTTASSTGSLGFNVKVIDDPSTAVAAAATAQQTSASGSGIYVWIHDNTIGASTGLAPLQSFESALGSGSNSFKSSSFYSDISAVYANGAGMIVAADLESIMAGLAGQQSSTAQDSAGVQSMKRLGLFSLKHFIFETKGTNGNGGASAVLTFNEPRQGIASWLAAPGPMGALDYVSPDANLVAGFVVQDTSKLVNDLTGALGTVDSSFAKDLAALQTQGGINISTDIGGSLGGEYAFAIDGPLLPSPSWKMIIEVNDQAHLQQTLEQVVTGLNQLSVSQGKSAQLQWQQSTIGGQLYYTLKPSDLAASLTYTYSGGYMILASSSALIDRAIRYKAMSYNLPHSQQFIAALPGDHNANFSAIIYHNLGAAVGSLANSLSGQMQALTPDKQNAIKSFANSGPAIAYAYAEGDHITFSTGGNGGLFGLGADTFLGAPGPFELQSIVSMAAEGH
jgi:hypothetical protein